MSKTFAWTVGAAATKFSNDTGTGYEEPMDDCRHVADGGQIITQVFEEQASEIKISSWQAGVVFFKSCFGVCTLGMPFAFRNSGIIPGVLFLIVVALITNFATKLLVWNKRHLQETRCKGIVSIPDMALTLWGASGLAFTNTVILICQIGNCIAYFIFLSISLTAVIEDFFPSLAAEHAYSPYVVLILCWCSLDIIKSVLFLSNFDGALAPLNLVRLQGCHLFDAGTAQERSRPYAVPYACSGPFWSRLLLWFGLVGFDCCRTLVTGGTYIAALFMQSM